MLLNLDCRQWKQTDVDLLNNNLEEIIQLGLKTYKKKHNSELTYAESVLLNIFMKDGYKYLSKEEVTNKYNEIIYKERTDKYMEPQNIVTKISRVNRKLKSMKIINKYGYGYMLKIG